MSEQDDEMCATYGPHWRMYLVDEMDRLRAEVAHLRAYVRHKAECAAAAWEQRKAAYANLNGGLPNYPRPGCTCGLDRSAEQQP